MSRLWVVVCAFFVVVAVARAEDDTIFGDAVEGATPSAHPTIIQTTEASRPIVSWDDPSAAQVFTEGVLLTIPEFFLGNVMHEGSHALAVLALGGEVTDINLLPHHMDGRFVFGSTSYRGQFTKNERAFFSLAPKITGLTVLGAYTALLETDSLPSNKNLQLLVVVVATGTWIDFMKDLFATNPGNDVVKVFNDYGLESERQRAPYRALYGVVAAAAGYEVGKGIYRLFKHREPKRKKAKDVVVLPGYVGVNGSF